jgi:two-component system, NarL family, sensor histidine kinase DesK
MPDRMPWTRTPGWLKRKPDSGAGRDANDFGAGVIDFRHDAESAADGSGFRSSKRLSRGLLLAVLGGFAAVEIINVLSGPGSSRGYMIALSIACLAAMFALQIVISSRAAVEAPLLWRAGMLLALAVVTCLPLLALGHYWAGMAGWLAGSILLLLPGRIAWTLFGVIIFGELIGSLLLGLDAYTIGYYTVASMDTGLVVFGLSRLSLSISYLQETRTELAQLAVIRERMRFARDLHDLLGYSLSAITLKAEFTRRMVGGNPERARDELAELLDIARQALADVRLVASGYRNMSLSKEATEVASLLSTAGIGVRIEINCGPLDEDVDTALATVLREAVTNMLRHSSAQNCTILSNVADGVVSLQVTNDGVPVAAGSHRDGGGLQNLALRMDAVGGKLNVNRYDDRFEVLATVPLPALGR